MTRIVIPRYCHKSPHSWGWCLVVSGIHVMIGLAVIDPALGAENGIDGAYSGKRVLTKGSNQMCQTNDDVSVTIRGDVLTVSNSRLHNFAMGFEPHPDGSFSQLTAGADGGYLSIHGRVSGDAIEADSADSACEYHWHLVRNGPG